MQRHVRRIAGWWKGQWNTQESIHSIRKWTQPHTYTRPSSYAGIQRAHLDPLFLSCVSRVSPLTCETERISCSVLSDSLGPHGLQPTRLLCPGDSPGKSTGVGCYTFLQGIFLTQRSNLGLMDCSGFFTIWATKEAPIYKMVLYEHLYLIYL